MSSDDTHDHLSGHEPEDEELIDLSSLLADPAVWEATDGETEDAIVALISAEVAGSTEPSTAEAGSATDLGGDDEGQDPTKTSKGAEVVPISSARRWVGSLAAGVAAAVALIALYAAGTTMLGTDEAEPSGTEFALEATELAPDSEATALIADTPQGTKILLDVSGLPPAGEGTYYEAWLRQSPEVGVSAGTFHLRGGDGVIELWAGVTVTDYPLFTVTIQDEAMPESSGAVVLKVDTSAAG
jgi:hypothetical protein